MRLAYGQTSKNDVGAGYRRCIVGEQAAGASNRLSGGESVRERREVSASSLEVESQGM